MRPSEFVQLPERILQQLVYAENPKKVQKNKKEKRGANKTRLKTGSDFSETRAIIHNFEKIRYKINLGSSKCQKDDHTKKHHSNIVYTLIIIWLANQKILCIVILF